MASTRFSEVDTYFHPHSTATLLVELHNTRLCTILHNFIFCIVFGEQLRIGQLRDSKIAIRILVKFGDLDC